MVECLPSTSKDSTAIIIFTYCHIWLQTAVLPSTLTFPSFPPILKISTSSLNPSSSLRDVEIKRDPWSKL